MIHDDIPAQNLSRNELTALIATLRKEVADLRHENSLYRRMIFGPRSERFISDPADQSKFDSLLKYVDAQIQDLVVDKEIPERDTAQKKSGRKRKPRRSLKDIAPADLPEEEVYVDLPESEKIHPETGTCLEKIGEERSRKLAYRPGHYFWLVYVRPQYAAPKDPSFGVSVAPMPDIAIPGGLFDESFCAEVIVNRCSLHLPFYRQAEKLRYAGINASRQQLSRLFIRCSEVLAPLYRVVVSRILSSGIIFTDDTPVKLLAPGKGKTITGRMWVYVAGGKGPPYRVFEFSSSRSQSYPRKFLENFRGYMHADAFPGYDVIFMRDGVYECACWMHIRRYFHDATDAPSDLRQKVLELIQQIYLWERKIDGLEDEQITAIRTKHVVPLIDEILDRTSKALLEVEVLPKSKFAGAIGYLHNLGQAVKTFTTHPDLKPDNGASERAIRPLAIGRRNWLFAGSESGGRATGIHLSLVQSCRVMGIDPFEYLTDVLRRINGHMMARIDELLPENWSPIRT